MLFINSYFYIQFSFNYLRVLYYIIKEPILLKIVFNDKTNKLLFKEIKFFL